MTQVARAGASTLAIITLLAGTATGQEVFSTRVATGFTKPGVRRRGTGASIHALRRPAGRPDPHPEHHHGQIGATPFLNLTVNHGHQLVCRAASRDCSGLAFHPNFQSNGLVLRRTTRPPRSDRAGDPCRGVPSREWDRGRRQPTDHHRDQPPDGDTTTTPGWIGFNPLNGTTGPNSGQLYITAGRRRRAERPGNNAQNTNVLLGKILRIDVNTTSGGQPTTVSRPAT